MDRSDVPSAASDSKTQIAPPRSVRPTERPFDFLGPSEASDEIGRLGGYRVLKVLGKGGMGVVFLAEDIALQRSVALKVMLPQVSERPTARDRFLREARAAAKLEHDHIITVHQVGEDRGVPFIAMPFLQGCSLEDALRTKEGSRPDVRWCLRVGREIALGLAAAHERGLIHRDVKPANVWLDASADGRVKILDFGLARLADGDGHHLTHSGAIVGTPAYMAPEQARSETLDGRADLFSLGVVLYRLCTGQLPFKGHDLFSTLIAVAQDTPRPPAALNPMLPAALSDLVMRLLEKDPTQRPATATEVAVALQTIEQEMTTEETPALERTATLPGPIMAPPVPSRRLPVIAAVLALLTLVGAFVAAGLMRDRTPSATILVQATTPTVLAAATTPTTSVIVPKPAEGTLVLQIDDPAAVVVIRRDGVVIQERTTNREFRLGAGEGVVEVYRGNGTPALKTARFTLDRDAKVTLRVELPPPPAERIVVAEPALLSGHTEAIWGVRFLPDGKRVLSVAWDGTLRVWEVASGKELAKIQAIWPNGFRHWDQMFQGLAVSPDGKWAAAGSSKEGAFLWELSSGKFVRQFRLPNDAPSGIRALAFTPSGDKLIAGALDGTLCVFGFSDGKLQRRDKVFVKEGGVACLQVLPDGRRVVLGAEIGPDAVLWDLEKNAAVRRFAAGGQGVYSLALDTEGRLYTGGAGGRIRIWNLETGEAVSALAGHSHRVRGLHTLPGGRVVSSSDDKTVRLWDIKAAKEIDRATVPEYVVAFSDVSPDGRRLVAGSGWILITHMDRRGDYRLRQFSLRAGE